MKILFVCSCLEPGMDGVGDYTRRLAAELGVRGYQCHLLALADTFVKEAQACEFMNATGAIMGLRLPASESWAQRVRQAKHFCESLAPDWVSWQIVPYGFDSRGLSFGLGRRLEEILGNCRSEVMFHEIWIGNAESSSTKHKIIGKLQRFIIKDLLKRLRPLVVHTHTPLYQHLLTELGFKARILPLFGNVPVAERMDTEWLKQKWPEAWGKFEPTNRDDWWVLVMFGSIHPEWDAEDFWQQATIAAKRAGKKSLLVSIGRPGPAGEEKLKQLQKHEDESWRVLNLGQQSEDDISQVLLAADFGASAAPPENVFKSGTVTAMIEHGLHVVVTRPVARYAGCPAEVLTVGMRNVLTNFDLAPYKKSKQESLLPAVASQFIEDLQRA